MGRNESQTKKKGRGKQMKSMTEKTWGIVREVLGMMEKRMVEWDYLKSK